jgi:hypothetical protein
MESNIDRAYADPVRIPVQLRLDDNWEFLMRGWLIAQYGSKYGTQDACIGLYYVRGEDMMEYVVDCGDAGMVMQNHGGCVSIYKHTRLNVCLLGVNPEDQRWRYWTKV